MEEALKLRNLLKRNGFEVAAVCTSGVQALSHADALSTGIMISGYRLEDMPYFEVKQDMPTGFSMLLLASEKRLADGVEPDVMTLGMPFVISDFLDTVQMMCEACYARKEKRISKTLRTEKDNQLIDEAKKLLMVRNGLSEEEAHKYLQKCSMDSGVNVVETAGMVLTMYS
ncbi:MAG: ANTAR domain-containing protein [Lachnospiraceae bacterium]|nr:ANTAR domain-containing protein [Lachnospiraceae bacterium]